MLTVTVHCGYLIKQDDVVKAFQKKKPLEQGGPHYCVPRIAMYSEGRLARAFNKPGLRLIPEAMDKNNHDINTADLFIRTRSIKIPDWEKGPTPEMKQKLEESERDMVLRDNWITGMRVGEFLRPEQMVYCKKKW